MTMQEMKFSVIMSIYQNDVPEHLHIALESLLNQTRRPDEIVIVGDGPVPAELEQEIERLPTDLHRFTQKTETQAPSNSRPPTNSPEEAPSNSPERGWKADANEKCKVQGSKLHTDSTELTDSITQTSRSLPLGGAEGGFNSQSSILNLQGHETVIRYLPQEKNRGLGAALAIAVEAAQYPYLARMDADDIAVPDRFEKQLRFLEQHPDVAAVGGMIEDFSTDPNHVTGRRIVPLESEDIHRYMRSRNGMNHVTVMFKKEELLRVGNYQPFHLNEDYYLWVRMIQQGCQLMNIPDVLVRVRAEKEQVDRRGGFPYFRDQYRVFKYMLNTGFISWPRFLLNICERGTVQLLMPLSVRCWFYQRFLRK